MDLGSGERIPDRQREPPKSLDLRRGNKEGREEGGASIEEREQRRGGDTEALAKWSSGVHNPRISVEGLSLFSIVPSQRTKRPQK